jgi:hypothetical protein
VELASGVSSTCNKILDTCLAKCEMFIFLVELGRVNWSAQSDYCFHVQVIHVQIISGG